MKKLLTLFIFTVLVLFATSLAQAEVLEVGPAGGGAGILDDIEVRFWQSIQDAINHANPDDTILVYPGTYEEDLVVNVDDLTIASTDGNSVTIIKGVANVNEADWPLAAPNIEITGSGVEIYGFTIQGPDYEALKYSSGMVIAGDNVKIHNNIFQPTNANSLNEISQAIVTYRDGNGGEDGLDGLNIYDNAFEPLAEGTHGIEAIFINHTLSDPNPAGAVTIQNNVITGAVVRGITTERSNVIITGNTVETNLDPYSDGVGAFQGILVQDFGDRDQKNVTVTDNTVQGSSGFNQGIRVGSALQVLSGISIQNNSILSNNIGVQVRSAAGVAVNNNEIAGNTIGVENTGAVELDATYNWWNDVAGPNHPVSNPGSSGDEVSSNVDYDPWCTDPDCGASGIHPVVNVTQEISYSTIMGAIVEAYPNDQITVAAGTFVEQVEITIPLTITGAGQGSTVIQSPDVLTLYYTTSADNYPIVYLHDVDGVVITDLTIDGAGKGNDNYRFNGIAFRQAGGTIQDVSLINVMDTPFSGAQHGVAIYAYNDNGIDRNINILSCTINDFQKTAIALNGVNSICTVEDCNVVGAGDTTVTAQNGIQFGWGAGGTIKHNTVSDIRYTGENWSASGILGYGDGSDAPIDVQNNTVTNTQGALQIYFFDGDVNVADNDLSGNDFSFLYAFDTASVTGNTFDNCIQGLYLADVTNINASDNTFNDCDEGLIIDGATDNVTFTHCQFNDNTGNGITVVPYETDNPDNISISCSQIAGNMGYGLENTSINVVDAENNWWDSSTGPGGVGGGSGDDVSANVDFFPWLLSIDGCEDYTKLAPDYVVDDDWAGLPDFNQVFVGGQDYYISLNAFDTIQEAVDAAADGNSIKVYDGNYSPFIVDGKTNLTITAGSNPVVTGVQSVTTNYGPRDCVVFVNDSVNVMLNMLDIQGSDLGTINAKNYGVICENSSGSIKDCTVSPNTAGDMASTAIGIWDGSVVSVVTTLIENYGRVGVLVYYGADAQILDNEIIGQVYADEGQVCYGIEVEAMSGTDDPATASSAVIKRNEIYNCDNTFEPEPSWGSSGIYINGWKAYGEEAESAVTVVDNVIHDNYEGIYVVDSPSSRANFNSIYDNRTAGVTNAAGADDSNSVFDAEYNWWGDISGPNDSDPNGTIETDGSTICPTVEEIKNADGLGNKVTENVLYCPWLVAPISSSAYPCPAGDLDGDCDVDFADLAILAGNWLEGTEE